MPIAADAARVARGRMFGTGPVGIIDAGSNSVRLVLYEQLSRAPTVLFNEKVLAGLARGLAKRGTLNPEGVWAALAAIRRFAEIARQSGVRDLVTLATAACREADDGPAFLATIEDITGAPVHVLSGREEAELAAAGVLCGFHEPDGVVGDLGGGSLEVIDVARGVLGPGETFPLGGLRLMEDAGGSVRKATRIAGDALASSAALKGLAGRTFYAVGGTWRSLARLHMAQADYPFHIMHAYRIPAVEAVEFCRSIRNSDVDLVGSIEVVSRARRPLLAAGAAVLEQVVAIGRPETVVISALGVREGWLYRRLTDDERRQDPLLIACEELALLRARSPQHAVELIDWTRDLFAVLGVDETPAEARLRAAGCLVGDIGWRAHPDYRGEQAIGIMSNSAFVGIDHAGRGMLALAIWYRYAGLTEGEGMPRIRELVSTRLKARARFLGAALRVAYVIAPTTPGIVPQTRVTLEGERLVLHLPKAIGNLDGERLRRRWGQLAALASYSSTLVVD